MNKVFEKTQKIYRRVCFSVLLFFRRNKKRFFYLSFKKGIPKIHVNEQYEVSVKWILRILTAIGIFSSVFAFQQWYFNLILALCLLGLGQFLERSVFMYFTFYLSAIPKFESKDWVGMVWVYPYPGANKYFEVGILFSSRESAERIFSTIKHWSKEGEEDTSNLFQLSVIINEKADLYHVYFYQNTERDPTFLALKKERDDINPKKEHIMEFIGIMFCKGFKYSTSTFPKFQKSYREGDSYYLQAYILENNRPVKIAHLGFIKKNSIKIKNQKDLTRADREYEHMEFIVDVDKYKNEPPPPPSREFISVSRRPTDTE